MFFQKQNTVTALPYVFPQLTVLEVFFWTAIIIHFQLLFPASLPPVKARETMHLSNLRGVWLYSYVSLQTSQSPQTCSTVPMKQVSKMSIIGDGYRSISDILFPIINWLLENQPATPLFILEWFHQSLLIIISVTSHNLCMKIGENTASISQHSNTALEQSFRENPHQKHPKRKMIASLAY